MKLPWMSDCADQSGDQEDSTQDRKFHSIGRRHVGLITIAAIDSTG